MVALSGYSTGTVSIGSAATAVVGASTIWNNTNVRAGDTLIVAGHQVIIQDVTDISHLVIDAWPFTAVTGGTSYLIAHTSPLRYGANAQLAKDTSDVLAVLNTSGFFVFVDDTLIVPDPSLGEDNQFALQATTKKLWLKTGGVWSFYGYFSGMGIPAAYDNAHTYNLFDVATSGGSSYVFINTTPSAGHAPPNATYWALLAGVGATGPAAWALPVNWLTATAYVAAAPSSVVVINGSTYVCIVAHTSGTFATDLAGGKWLLVAQAAPIYNISSTASLLIATGSKAFTGVATNNAYQVGDYVRAKSAASGVNFMEGNVTANTPGTLTVNVTKIGGSGTFADWNISPTGAPGTGDILSTNNGSDFASAATFATNLGLVRYAAQTLTAAQQAQARANINVTKKNYFLNGGMMVSQENGTTAGTVSGYYPVDQFSVSFANAGAISTAQVASSTPGGSPNRLRVTVTSPDASVAAGDIGSIEHRIEGLRIADLRSGSSAAKTITLQFGVKAPAGTYCVSLRNSAGNRSYAAEYTISGGEANTDVVKSVTIALDQSGTWLNDTGIGVIINFALMAGTTYQATANTWSAGNFLATSNQFNFMGTNGNVFELFDVGLYEGSSAPAFQLPDFASELIACQRYFYQWVATGAAATVGMASGLNTTSALFLWQWSVAMRAAPTVTATGSGGFRTNGPVSAAISSFAFAGSHPNSVRGIATVSSGLTAGASYNIEAVSAGAVFTANSRL